VTYDVSFGKDAVQELLVIIGESDDDLPILMALQQIRSFLENDPSGSGFELSEGLFYVDYEPLRAFFAIYEEFQVVEVSDFRRI